MQKLIILNKKAIKEIQKLIKKQFNAAPTFDYAFLQDKENKIYIVNKEVFDINLENLNINSFGLYFGQIKNNELILSIEAAQLIGPYAKKNIIELTNTQLKQWLKGEDIPTNKKTSGFVIIKHNNDFFGTGKIKQNRIINFIPKQRRLKTVN